MYLVLTRLEINRLFLCLSTYSLTVCDIGLIVDMMIQKLATYHFDYPLWYNLSYPYFWYPLKGILLSANIFMTVAVSAERFRAICHPFSKRQVG